MAKKLYRFPNAKIALYATEQTMTNVCTAIEQELLAKYGGAILVGFDIVPGAIDDCHLIGEQLCYDVLVHTRRTLNQPARSL